MNRIRLVAALLLVAALCTGAWAQASSQYDGLTVLGTGHHFVDENGTTMDLMAFKTKYGEKVVGMYFTYGGKSVHFYMNAAVWDKMKQTLIRTRDQWQTLTPRTFEQSGTVQGYQIANQKAKLQIGVQGATAISPKQLLFTATGGPNVPNRLVISLSNDDLTALVNDLSNVDSLFRTNGNGAPASQ